MGGIIPSFMDLQRFESHAALDAQHKLVEAADENCVHLISHQWLSNTHPDPNGVQLRRMKDILREILAEGAEELFTEEDWPMFLRGLSAGTAKAAQIAESRKLMQLDANGVLTDVKDGLIWMDFFSIPQISDRVGSFDQCLEENLKAVNSIPAYVERCDYFWVLTPNAVHADSGIVCDFDSWRSRGWCRLEEWANALCLNRKMPLVISDARKLATVGSIDFILSHLGRPEKAACNGQFSCCGIQHRIGNVSDGFAQVSCDKAKVGEVLVRLCESKLDYFLSSGKRLMFGLLSCLKLTVYAGSPWDRASAAPNEPLTAFLRRIRYDSLDDVNELVIHRYIGR